LGTQVFGNRLGLLDCGSFFDVVPIAHPRLGVAPPALVRELAHVVFAVDVDTGRRRLRAELGGIDRVHVVKGGQPAIHKGPVGTLGAGRRLVGQHLGQLGRQTLLAEFLVSLLRGFAAHFSPSLGFSLAAACCLAALTLASDSCFMVWVCTAAVSRCCCISRWCVAQSCWFSRSQLACCWWPRSSCI